MNDTFVKHTSCPSCGSRDNRAVYKSGSSFCFGCGYYESSKTSPYVLQNSEDKHDRPLALPDDCSHEFPEHVLAWTNQYGLSIEQLIKNNVYYSKRWDQLIFAFFDADKRVILWQGRNFEKSRAAKRKYFTQGDPAKVLPIYSTSAHRTLVLVEDCVSAIKLSQYVDSMPVLGSTVARSKLTKLKPFYDDLIIWLDGNMYHNAQAISKSAQLLGFNSSVIWTEKDPKEIDNKEILELISSYKALTQ